MPKRKNSDEFLKKGKKKEPYVDELKLLDELCSGVKKLLNDNRHSKASRVLGGKCSGKKYSSSRKQSNEINF